MLVTLAATKAYLGITTTTDDAFLTSQINLLSEVIEAYCRRKFVVATYVQSYYKGDYKWSSEIETFHYPLISVASIVEDGVTVDSSLYRVHKPTGVILRTDCGYFFRGVDATVITYDSGYATIPLPIQNVMFDLIQQRYNKSKSDVDLSFGPDVQKISIPGSISIDYDYSLASNDRKSAFGVILGTQVNVIDFYRSHRSIQGESKLIYLG